MSASWISWFLFSRNWRYSVMALKLRYGVAFASSCRSFRCLAVAPRIVSTTNAASPWLEVQSLMPFRMLI